METEGQIQFYENIQNTRDKMFKSETERIHLEKEFLRSLQSDDKIVKTKTLKLQAYYKKLCEDEKASQIRNQQLLADLASIEAKFQHLEEKLQRLAKFKNECHAYIQSEYPQWNDVKSRVLGNDNNNADQRQQAIDTLLLMNNKRQNELSESINELKNLPNLVIQDTVSANANHENLLKFNSPRPAVSSYDNDNYNRRDSLNIDIHSARDTQRTAPKTPTDLPDDATNRTRLSSGKSYNVLQNVLVNPLIPEYAQIPGNLLINSHNSEQLLNMSGSLTKPPQGGVMHNDYLVKEYQKVLERQDSHTLQQHQLQQQQQLYIQQQQQQYKLSSTVITPTTEEIHERGIDLISKPTSPRHLIAKFSRNIEEAYTANNKDDSTESSDAFNQRRNSLRQELNVKALFRLLDFIESDMSHTIHREKYYRQMQPHYKNKLEIIKHARDGESLKEMDAGNVSMVVLDQISHVIRKNTKTGCIFTREILSFSVADINDKVVSRHLKDSKDKELWSRLVNHWCILKMFGVIDAATIGHLFGASLISKDGYGVEKSEQFIEKIVSTKSHEDENEKSENTVTFSEKVRSSDSYGGGKLKETQIYQTFVSSTKKTASVKSRTTSDDDDEIDRLVAPMSGNQSGVTSPRKTKAGFFSPPITPRTPRQLTDRELEASQKSLVNSILKSSSSKEKRPIHLRNYQDSDVDESETSNGRSMSTYDDFKQKNKNNDDFEFYN